jgi:outer membrane receptor protein involved in Fe transport
MAGARLAGQSRYFSGAIFMSRSLLVRSLKASTILGVLAAVAVPAFAQTEGGVETVVVTGSRIHRDGKDTTTSQPVSVVSDQTLVDRGYVNAAQAVRDLPSAFGSATPLSPNNGSAGGVNGAQYINLFNLGAGRTLTLVNGRRFVSSAPPDGNSNPNGDNLVDPSLIPVSLLDRVEVVEAGGAAVYGSDAIGGVVNYVLKDHFQGIEFDSQWGQSTYGDYPVSSLRATAGTDFLDGRGNVAVDFEFSQTGSLLNTDRKESSTNMHLVVANTDFVNPHFWEFNNNGIPFIGVPDGPPGAPATGWQVPPVPIGAPFCSDLSGPPPQICFVYGAPGTPLQFGPGGILQPYDVGATPLGIPFTSGGQGFPYANLSSLFASVKRQTGNLIGHYDITDNIKLSTEVMFARVDGDAPFSLAASNAIISPAPAQGIWFNATDPRLPAATQGFLFGYLGARGLPPVWPLFLSKSWDDLTTSTANTTRNDTFRAVLSLDGDFNFADRDMYWSISGTYGRVHGRERSTGVDLVKFEDMIGAPIYPGGYNAAGLPTAGIPPFFQFPPCVGPHAFAGCTPINPFDPGSVTDAQREMLSLVLGNDYTNRQTDVLVTLGGSFFTLPAGDAKFSVSYEHRDEKAAFNPTPASAAGLDIQAAGIGVLATGGQYHTNEFSGEVDLPLVSEAQNIKLVRVLDLNGAVRWVDNSIAGHNTAWDIGLKWTLLDGFSLRGTRSSNFRAPSLTQVFLPTTAGFGAALTDPCSRDNLFGGPNPTVRLAHCQAEWAANGDYGGNPLATAPGGAGFQDINENVPGIATTNGGNPGLRNEVSKTNTVGFIFQPEIAPGLTIVADHIGVDIANGFAPLTIANLLSICYDSPTIPASCGAAFTRNAATGNLATANTLTAINAASVKFRGETYNVNYQIPVNNIFGGDENMGDLDFDFQATHVSLLSTSFVTGGTPTRLDGTRVQPSWTGKFDLHYAIDAMRLNYSIDWLGRTRNEDQQGDLTPLSIYPSLSSNIRHNLSAQYDITEMFTLRAGVNNFTNERPSFPSIAYGDIIGRQYFVGLNAHL